MLKIIRGNITLFTHGAISRPLRMNALLQQDTIVGSIWRSLLYSLTQTGLSPYQVEDVDEGGTVVHGVDTPLRARYTNQLLIVHPVANTCQQNNVSLSSILSLSSISAFLLLFAFFLTVNFCLLL